MRMKADEFFRRMQVVEETWEEVLKAYYVKKQKMEERMKMITSIFDIKPRDIISDFLNEQVEAKLKEEEDESRRQLKEQQA